MPLLEATFFGMNTCYNDIQGMLDSQIYRFHVKDFRISSCDGACKASIRVSVKARFRERMQQMLSYIPKLR